MMSSLQAGTLISKEQTREKKLSKTTICFISGRCAHVLVFYCKLKSNIAL